MKYSIIKLMIFAFLFVSGYSNVRAAPSILQGTILISPDSSSAIPVNGVIDVAAGTISIDSFIYRSSPFTIVSGEYLESGTYYRTNYSGNSAYTRYAVIEEGNVGGYFVMSWAGETFTVFMQWAYDELLQTYTNIPFFGNIIRQGVLKNNNLIIDFKDIEPGLWVHPSISIAGGNTQQCTQTGGSMVSFNATVTMNLTATLDRIDWVLDGVSIPGQGDDITVFAGLGTHVIEATATTNEGASETTSASFSVVDTTAPTLEILFVDSSGQSVSSAAAGDVEIRFVAADICDPAPVVTGGNANPVMNIVDRDVIRIVQQDNNVIIPTTGVAVGATVVDASGNRATASSTLLIE